MGGTAFWYFTKEKQKAEKGTYYTEAMDFAVDRELLHKIFIADREGNTTTLLKVEDEWLLEGKQKMRPNAINLLLMAIEGLEVKYRPAKAMYPRIVEDLATFGIEVELYDENDKLLKNYYVGGLDEAGDGTFMIMADSEDPLVMHLKNFVGGLRIRYDLHGDEWRDRSVFAAKPDNIQRVSVEYPKQKNKSFILTRDGENFEVKPFYATTPIIDAPVIRGRPEVFLNSFKKKIAEDFQNEFVLKDYALSRTPFAIVTMTKKDGSEKSVRFIPYQKSDKNGNPIKQDPNLPIFRYHADTSWGDLMLVQHGVFEEMFVSYDSFFK
jgi:hypothetical protein